MKLWDKIKANWKAMTPSEKFSAILKTVTSVTVIGGVIYCGHTLHESRDLVDFAVQKIGDNVEVDVSDELIKAAIDRAAEQQIKRTVIAAAAKTGMDIADKTDTEVKKAVSECYDKISDGVADRLAKECEKLNRHEILEEIKSSAADKLAEKLDGNLDAITDEYSKNLNNMGKVYEALATKLERKA